MQVHDPWGPAYTGDLSQAITGSDAMVLMVAHDAYRSLDLGHLRGLMRVPVLVEGWKVFVREQVEAAGFQFYSVCIGRSMDRFRGERA